MVEPIFPAPMTTIFFMVPAPAEWTHDNMTAGFRRLEADKAAI
jgi:hypothetical protein